MKIELLGGPCDGKIVELADDFSGSTIKQSFPERIPATEFKAMEDRVPVMTVYRSAVYRKTQVANRWEFVE